jgi:hypothetical protein
MYKLYKNLIILCVVLLIYGCNRNSYIRGTHINRCKVLDYIVNFSELKQLLGFETSEHMRMQPIRFFDIHSRKFLECHPYYRDTTTGSIVWGFVVPKLEPNLNTGQFRDVVLLKYKEKKDRVYVSLVAAFFIGQVYKEGLPYIEYELKIIDKEQISIEKVSYRLVNYDQPPVDYD